MSSPLEDRLVEIRTYLLGILQAMPPLPPGVRTNISNHLDDVERQLIELKEERLHASLSG